MLPTAKNLIQSNNSSFKHRSLKISLTGLSWQPDRTAIAYFTNNSVVKNLATPRNGLESSWC